MLEGKTEAWASEAVAKALAEWQHWAETTRAERTRGLYRLVSADFIQGLPRGLRLAALTPRHIDA